MPLPASTISLRPKYDSGATRDGGRTTEKLSGTRPRANNKPSSPSDSESGSTDMQSPTRLPQLSGIPQRQAPGLKRVSLLSQRRETRTLSLRGRPGEDTQQSEAINKPTIANSKDTGTSTTMSALVKESVPARTMRPRPQSMYQTAPVKHDSLDMKRRSQIIEPSDPAKNTEPTKNTLMPPPARIGRTLSLRKATPSSHSRQSPTARVEKPSEVVVSKPTSTTAAAGAVKERLRERSTTLKPSTHVRKASAAAMDETPSSLRTSHRITSMQTGTQRSASTSSKSEHPDSAASSKTTDTAVLHATSSSSRHREVSREDPSKRARPAFSTLQQHFTPRKTGKAPTSTFIHPAVPDAALNGLTFEVQRLQAELLQLHLLRESLDACSQQWRSSAERTLNKKFDEVASKRQVMRDNERQAQENKNLLALQEWTSGSSSFALAENLQLLSAPLHELPLLADTGGRFRQHVDEFEEWSAWVQELWENRKKGSENGKMDLSSAEGLGEAWVAENEALMRKLVGYMRDVEQLSEPAPGSSIAVMVRNCQALVEAMLRELWIMRRIETDVVSKEREWIEQGLQALAEDIDSHLVIAEDGCESWRG